VEPWPWTYKDCFGSDDQDEDYLDYLDYGQWPATFGGQGCTLYVDSSAIDGFDPPAHAGETLPVVRGLLERIRGHPEQQKRLLLLQLQSNKLLLLLNFRLFQQLLVFYLQNVELTAL